MDNQEPLISNQKMSEYKQKEFREYLVKQDMVLAMVKFLLSIRNAKEKPDSPSQALIDYFGAYKDDSWKQFEELSGQVSMLKEENESLANEIVKLGQNLEDIKLSRLRRDDEEKQKETEALTKKDSKKPMKR